MDSMELNRADRKHKAQYLLGVADFFELFWVLKWCPRADCTPKNYNLLIQKLIMLQKVMLMGSLTGCKGGGSLPSDIVKSNMFLAKNLWSA